ncbi:energy transducer TonB [Chitinophaga sp. XS-30]|uniref:energy transducer TonB family protein n=1 Tax=Chitinophaga sp. XS-30 TaxID=2604421 RepID=UPI0011DD072B|nr:energy transducer TonB [Chitinophaga sp. XS-30]QEH40283.1 hypothetical protein FW415_05105 [Chitinophaga sp. XS-30]
MADHKLHITAELIRRYLEGKLDDKTMHAIEKQALDDPFLAEALEGYARQAEDRQPVPADLRSRLEQRVSPPKGGLLRKMEYRWLAAASVLILLCITAVMLMRPAEKELDMAQVNPVKITDTVAPQKQPADTAIPRPMPPVPVEEQKGPEQDSPEKKAGEAKQPSEVTFQPSPPPALAAAKAKAEAADAAVARTEATQHAAARERNFNAVTAPVRQDSGLFAKAKVDTIRIRGIARNDNQPLSAKAGEKVEGLIAGEPAPYPDLHADANARLISGVVIDEKTGSRLPGVLVSLEGSNRGVVTDTSGGFALQVDKKDKIQLGFSSIGYERKSVAVAQNTSRVNVALPSNNEKLEEVVVTGYGRSRKKAVILPSPSTGEPAYRAYLESRKTIQLKGNNIQPDSGTVLLSFTVMPDSTLRDFKVLQTMGSVADEAAIRIVAEGPRWHPVPGRKRGATATLEVPIIIKKEE